MKTRLNNVRDKLLRRTSGTSSTMAATATATDTASSREDGHPANPSPSPRRSAGTEAHGPSRLAMSTTPAQVSGRSDSGSGSGVVAGASANEQRPGRPDAACLGPGPLGKDLQPPPAPLPGPGPASTPASHSRGLSQAVSVDQSSDPPASTPQRPAVESTDQQSQQEESSPDASPRHPAAIDLDHVDADKHPATITVAPLPSPSPSISRLQSNPHRPKELVLRRQSLVPSGQTRLLSTLLESEKGISARDSSPDLSLAPISLTASMVSRKIWVKRPGASATLVTVKEDDLVDDVRDMILKKYANSLGRSFDAPDVTLRIAPRVQRGSRPSKEDERTLGPEEPITRTLDEYFPGGQTVEEALVIDVPRRTPRASPRMGHHVSYYATEDHRPDENGTDYFPRMPVVAPLSPNLAAPSVSNASIHGGSHQPSVHSISVLNTGQVPPLPSPGNRSARHHRPKYGRQHTSSPTVLTSAPPAHNEVKQPAPAPPPIPSPPAPEIPRRVATPPPPRVASPRPKPKKSKKVSDHPHLPVGSLDGSVPPINVLIVEDNIINLRLLEAFMKRLKVRWQTAMNGQEAVKKWRVGGFHLVLMDIQLPVMNGLDATKEIRRLERLNSVGVFSSSASSSAPETSPTEEPKEEDKLYNRVLFKSPVIIVALTASSLQSDRHEALAAGCNDFLTKPVNFVWLERKVMEWGCMQALIDFDGWRKWKDFSQSGDENSKPAATLKPVGAKGISRREKRSSLSSPPITSPPEGIDNKIAVGS